MHTGELEEPQDDALHIEEQQLCLQNFIKLRHKVIFKFPATKAKAIIALLK